MTKCKCGRELTVPADKSTVMVCLGCGCIYYQNWKGYLGAKFGFWLFYLLCKKLKLAIWDMRHRYKPSDFKQIKKISKVMAW